MNRQRGRIKVGHHAKPKRSQVRKTTAGVSGHSRGQEVIEAAAWEQSHGFYCYALLHRRLLFSPSFTDDFDVYAYVVSWHVKRQFICYSLQASPDDYDDPHFCA